MADYLFRYALLNAPAPRDDGSAQVAHDIAIVTLPDDGSAYTQEDWRFAPQAPGHHKTILLPGVDLSTALSMGTTGQKVAAYKDLLVTHHQDGAEPLDTNWNLNLMEQFMDNNDTSAAAATEADTFIRSVDVGAYPVTFTL